MNIFENIAVSSENDCKHCFKTTKEQIDAFFDYCDCNGDGFVSAENMFHGMANLKDIPYKTTTTMINDFVLHAMEHTSAGMDRRDFTYGLLVGMFERIITDDHMSEIEVNSMKVVRRHNIRDGFGPGRRFLRK